jgi:PAS domain-containing protein
LYRWFECHYYPSEEGDLVYFRNVTERKRTEDDVQQLLGAACADREWLSLVLDSITDEVRFTDTQKRHKLANRSALREFGHSSVGGRSVEEAFDNLVILRADGSPLRYRKRPCARCPVKPC